MYILGLRRVQNGFIKAYEITVKFHGGSMTLRVVDYWFLYNFVHTSRIKLIERLIYSNGIT